MGIGHGNWAWGWGMTMGMRHGKPWVGHAIGHGEEAWDRALLLEKCENCVIKYNTSIRSNPLLVALNSVQSSKHERGEILQY